MLSDLSVAQSVRVRRNRQETQKRLLIETPKVLLGAAGQRMWFGNRYPISLTRLADGKLVWEKLLIIVVRNSTLSAKMVYVGASRMLAPPTDWHQRSRTEVGMYAQNPSPLDQAQDLVRVGGTAAWLTSQVVRDAKTKSLHDGDGPNEGIWTVINPQDGHTGTPPRRIDRIAHRTMAKMLLRYEEDAVINSEEGDEVWEGSPGQVIFKVDPEDGTDPGRAVGFGDSSVVLAYLCDRFGAPRFVGGAIATGEHLVEYTVFNRRLVDARLATPPPGVNLRGEMPTSATSLATHFLEIVPGDSKAMCVVGARPHHRARPAVRALLDATNPAWVVGLGGTPMVVRLTRGTLGAVVAPGPQKLRDAAHLPLVAGLVGGLVTDFDGQPLDIFELFETSAEIPASIAASAPEALEAVLTVISKGRSD